MDSVRVLVILLDNLLLGKERLELCMVANFRLLILRVYRELCLCETALYDSIGKANLGSPENTTTLCFFKFLTFVTVCEKNQACLDIRRDMSSRGNFCHFQV